MGLHPGRESGERSEMIVDGRSGHVILAKLLLPGEDITLQTGRDAVMPIGGEEERSKPFQMESNLLSDGVLTGGKSGGFTFREVFCME